MLNETGVISVKLEGKPNRVHAEASGIVKFEAIFAGSALLFLEYTGFAIGVALCAITGVLGCRKGVLAEGQDLSDISFTAQLARREACASSAGRGAWRAGWSWGASI